jgi:hypothetical protein
MFLNFMFECWQCVTRKSKISYTLRNPRTLQTEANVSRKASAFFYQSIRRPIPEGVDLH